MDKLDMLDTIDSLKACTRGSTEDIDTLVERQLECKPNDELEAYFRNNQTTYYRDNYEDFKDDYQWEFIDDY